MSAADDLCREMSVIAPGVLRDTADLGDTVLTLKARLGCDLETAIAQQEQIPPPLARFAVALAGRRAELAGRGHSRRETLYLLCAEGWLETALEHISDYMGEQ